MPKGLFTKPIIINWSNLKSIDRENGNVVVNDNSHTDFYHRDLRYFVVIIANKNPIYYAVRVRYYGELKDDKFYINRFSYSIQHLPKELRREWGNAYRTAKYGLEMVGVVF